MFLVFILTTFPQDFFPFRLLSVSSREASQPDTAVSERGSSPALSDLNVQEYPPTGRFQSHEGRSVEAGGTKDESLSAEVSVIN